MNYLVPPRLPDLDDRDARILSGYRPSYYTAAGAKTADLHRLTRLRDGRVGALYDVKILDPYTRRYQSSRYLYHVVGGIPRELKKLSVITK